MWIPRDANEIERAARAGDLPETPSFDAKADLPKPNKNADLATDVAAMATDGGVLLYGVAEDEHKRPTIPNPIALAGAADRVGQIVSTSIAEVPYIEAPREYPCADDPSRGYLLVIVPQSPRAPHQVTVGRDLRFYGRGAKGNRILTEGDVARLYERRQAWQVDQQQLLVECIDASGMPANPGMGYVHAFARPVAPDPGILERALDALGGPQDAHRQLLRCVSATKLHGKYSPSLEGANYWQRPSADERRFATRDIAEYPTPAEIIALSEVRLNIDGRGHLFVGRATDTRLHDRETAYILEIVIAGNFEAFLAIMGMLYDAAAYHGHVDVGIALTGIQGAPSSVRSQDLYGGNFAYGAPTFTRPTRLAAAELTNADAVAHKMLRGFYESTTGIDGYSPFTQP